jgi:DNA-binding transcriptional LysR family regulator
MSAALARLRRHFGDDLLEREGRGYQRTVFGEQLLPAVRDALLQLEATMQRSPRFDPGESDREFSIAASDYTVSILADPLLRLVKGTTPRISLNLHPLPPALPHAPHVLSTDDLLIGPVGYEFPGRRVELFRPVRLRGRPGRERAGRGRRAHPRRPGPDAARRAHLRARLAHPGGPGAP